MEVGGGGAKGGVTAVWMRELPVGGGGGDSSGRVQGVYDDPFVVLCAHTRSHTYTRTTAAQKYRD